MTRKRVPDVTKPLRSVKTIDLTPTWEEWAGIYARFAEGGARESCAILREDLMRMARLADTLVAQSKARRSRKPPPPTE